MTSGLGNLVLRKLRDSCTHNTILLRKALLLSCIIGEKIRTEVCDLASLYRTWLLKQLPILLLKVILWYRLESARSLRDKFCICEVIQFW